MVSAVLRSDAMISSWYNRDKGINAFKTKE